MGSVVRAPATAGDLNVAVARIESRFGVHALARGAAFERRSSEGTLRLGNTFDRLAGGVPLGSPSVFAGQGTSGKLLLALRAAAAAQREGAHVMWVDPSASLDPAAAQRAGIDLDRLLVVRASTRDDALFAAAAGLRSGGFRLVTLDTGPELLAPLVRADDVAPLVAIVRGSQAALVVVSDRPAQRLALPTFHFTQVAFDRYGWTFSVRTARGGQAIFHSNPDRRLDLVSSDDGDPCVSVALRCSTHRSFSCRSCGSGHRPRSRVGQSPPSPGLARSA